MAIGLVPAAAATLALGLMAGSAAAGPGKGKKFGKLAAKQCAKERKAVGKATFREVHGKPAMRSCIKVTRKQATRNAAQRCREERSEMGRRAFASKYGKNANRRNAFGKCVSGKRAKKLKKVRRDRLNAARECRAERADPNFAATHGGMTFEQFYGSNRNRKNAFGKCVSGKAKAKSRPTPSS